ncbi:MAG: PEP-CTERM sorting domain-containing protein [Planctomycetia bacterium]|nr:PEP-CTERM sorting domain-containing protein [Planctomycetia bacterium]
MLRTSLFRWWGPCVLVAMGSLACPPSVGGEMISVANDWASLSGYVYADINNNGLRDSFERGITGVEILLQGINTLGDLVSRTALTDKSGDYQFASLSPGHYSVTETQPLKFIQGKPCEVGSAGGRVVDRDRFAEIDLASGVAAMDYNFGEWGLKAKYISKADLVVPEPSTLATLATALLALAAFVRFQRRRD